MAGPRRWPALLAKTATVATLAFLVGVVAAATAFLVGQPILHGNGFVLANGYPTVSLLDRPAARAVLGTGLYLALVAPLAVGVATVLRRAGAAVALLLGLLYLPLIIALTLPLATRGLVERLAPMTAGLSIQRTIERFDSVPINPGPDSASPQRGPQLPSSQQPGPPEGATPDPLAWAAPGRPPRRAADLRGRHGEPSPSEADADTDP